MGRATRTLRGMTDTLVDLHVAHLQAGGKSPRTVEARRSVLRLLDRHLPFGLAFAATEQIEAWLATRRSPWTLNVYAYHVVGFYRWAAAAGLLDGDPTATIAMPPHPRALPKPVTEQELALALELPEPFGTACALAGFAGLRASEIAACRREHIGPEHLVVPVGKGGAPGAVPCHPYLWRRVQSRPSGHLVTDPRGDPVSGHWLTFNIRARFDRIGLTKVTLHRLRHRFGTLIQELVGDIRVTQVCMRHASIASTEGYTLVTASRRTAAVAALPVPGAPASL